MAAICNSCNNGIMNSDFITCAGVCGELFHIKCIAVNKAMLNAVSNCPNIHWYCHDCNDGNRNVSASIKTMNDAIDRLAGSLSSDLIQFLNGLKLLMDNLVKSINTVNIVRNENNVSDSPNDTLQRGKSQCEDENAKTSKCHKGIVIGSNTKETLIAASTIISDHEPVKSVVVSNIAKNVSVDYLKNYLVDELKIEKEKVHLSLLLPTGRTVNDINFLQYKVTIPEVKYNSIMTPGTWPRNVRVRDFIYKPRKDFGASIQDFSDNRAVV